MCINRVTRLPITDSLPDLQQGAHISDVGANVCIRCGKPYKDHPVCAGSPDCVVLCGGWKVKL